MRNRKKFVVVFAGPVGSSKTPISFNLSQKFNLPIFNTDAIRTEVSEDLLKYDVKEYEKRRDERLRILLNTGYSFILDGSVDREWEKYEKWIKLANYQIFFISIDLSREFVGKLFKAKLYQATKHIDKWMNDHKIFLETYREIVDMHITDDNFKDRLSLSSEKLNQWINKK